MGAHSGAQIFVAALLAAYPWLAAWNLVVHAWRAWIVVVGLHALWLALRPAKEMLARRLLAALALTGLCGAAFVLLVMVYIRIGSELLGRDYYILASLLHAASAHPGSPPENLRWLVPNTPTYIQGYFDPITPLVNRALDITHDPVRLLAFHSVMTLTAPIAAWWIASTRTSLNAFQFALPVAVMMHPSMLTQMLSDYHTSEIGVGLLLLGTYFFFVRDGLKRRLQVQAFGALLLGTLAKISYWPSWLMFGILSAFRRHWYWTLAYGLVGGAALGIHQLLVQGQVTPGVATFFGAYGSTPSEVLKTLIAQPERWLTAVIQPNRWLFFLELLIPLGFSIVAFPLAVVPTLPLVLFTLLDSSAEGYRYSLMGEYGTEYLGYLVGGSLVGLATAPKWLRMAVLAVMTIGVPALISVRPGLYWTNISVQTAVLLGQSYPREAAFSECAVGSSPVAVTNYNWITYARETPDRVWVDDNEKSMTGEEVPWESFGTLIFPADTRVRGSLTNFPQLQPGYDVGRYGELLDRLPVRVLTPRGWEYRGGQRLAGCAARFGYPLAG